MALAALILGVVLGFLLGASAMREDIEQHIRKGAITVDGEIYQAKKISEDGSQ